MDNVIYREADEYNDRNRFNDTELLTIKVEYSHNTNNDECDTEDGNNRYNDVTC